MSILLLLRRRLPLDDAKHGDFAEELKRLKNRTGVINCLFYAILLANEVV